MCSSRPCPGGHCGLNTAASADEPDLWVLEAVTVAVTVTGAVVGQSHPTSETAGDALHALPLLVLNLTAKLLWSPFRG